MQYFLSNIILAASADNFIDEQNKTKESSGPTNCLLCNTTLVSVNLVVTPLSDTSGNSSANPTVITQQSQTKTISVCPNSNCNCSLAKDKGVYLTSDDLFLGEDNQEDAADKNDSSDIFETENS